MMLNKTEISEDILKETEMQISKNFKFVILAK